MTVAERLRNLHKKAYEANERRIRALVSTPRRFDRADLDLYERELIESIPKDFALSSPQELRRAIRASKIILVGDYHTLKQSQRGFLRVLRAVRSKRLTIALEFVMAKYQRHVDAYLQGRITEDAFLRRIRYEQSWPSYQVWPNFRPIFEFAMGRGAKVLALDCDPSECGTVFSRAAFAAWRIAEAAREDPRQVIAVLIGEAHLAPNHLPKYLHEALSRIGLSHKVLTIHQNLDPLYFELMKKGLDSQVDVVRLSEDRYCVPVSSPLAAQHSFLRAVSDEASPVAADDPASLRREFSRYVRDLARLLGLKWRGRLRGLVVCGPCCLDILAQVAGRLTPDAYQFLCDQVSRGESLYLAEAGLIYLAEDTPTHMAEEAAHFLKASEACGPIPEDPKDFVYSRIMHEAIGYFGSKVFNPKRKPPTPATLKQYALKSLDQSDEVAFGPSYAAALALWHFKAIRRATFSIESLDQHIRNDGLFPEGLADLGPEVVHPLVHFIGYEMGERLYNGFIGGLLSARDIRNLFRTNFEAPGQAFNTFKSLAQRLRSVRMPARF